MSKYTIDDVREVGSRLKSKFTKGAEAVDAEWSHELESFVAMDYKDVFKTAAFNLGLDSFYTFIRDDKIDKAYELLLELDEDMSKTVVCTDEVKGLSYDELSDVYASEKEKGNLISALDIDAVIHHVSPGFIDVNKKADCIRELVEVRNKEKNSDCDVLKNTLDSNVKDMEAMSDDDNKDITD